VAAVHLTATGVANNHGFWILHSVFNFCPKINHWHPICYFTIIYLLL